MAELSPQGYYYGKNPKSHHPFWDDSPPTPGDDYVTGVKGAAESEYRTGDVELSLPNIANIGNGLNYVPGDDRVEVSGLTGLEIQTLINLLD